MYLQTYLKRIAGSIINWDERQPDYTGRVHGESNEFGLVIVLRNLARLKRIAGADRDEYHVVEQREERRGVFHSALQDDQPTLFIGNIFLDACVWTGRDEVNERPQW